VHLKTGDLKANDLMRLWIRHLLLNTASPFTSTSVTKTGTFTIEPLDSSEILDKLMETFINGLYEPLMFNPYEAVDHFRLKLVKKEDRRYARTADTLPSFDICFGDGVSYDELIKNGELILGDCARHMRGQSE